MSPDEATAVRVLLVEDHAFTREGYTAYLTEFGYEIMPVGTGAEALRLAETWTPAVIVLDLGLPDIDGWEVARQLKAIPSTKRIPIIALTGANLTHEVISAMRAGCDRHLSKPCKPEDLVHMIRRCTPDLDTARF